jgi:hypothetical protein
MKELMQKIKAKEQESQSQNAAFIHPIMGDLDPYFIPKKTGLTFYRPLTSNITGSH